MIFRLSPLFAMVRATMQHDEIFQTSWKDAPWVFTTYISNKMCHKFKTCFNIVMPTNTITSIKTNSQSNCIQKIHFDLDICILSGSLDAVPIKLIECGFLKPTLARNGILETHCII
jgi:hypothetical protein